MTELVYEPILLIGNGYDADGRALAEEARALAANLDANLWKLAELAADAKQRKVRHWAEVIGVAVNRKDNRVRQWAKLAAWVRTVPALAGQTLEIRYSALEVLYKFRKRVPLDTLLEMFDVWRAEQGLSAETLAGNLQGLLPPKPGPDFLAQGKRIQAEAQKWLELAGDNSERCNHALTVLTILELAR